MESESNVKKIIPGVAVSGKDGERLRVVARPREELELLALKQLQIETN